MTIFTQMWLSFRQIKQGSPEFSGEPVFMLFGPNYLCPFGAFS